MSRYMFYEDRATHIREQLKETTDGVEGNKDLSAGNITVYFRAFPRGVPSENIVSGTATVGKELTKVTGDTDPGDTGIVQGDPVIGSGHRRITCRLVVSDSETDDSNTPSGYIEFVWLEFSSIVRESPQ